MKYPFNGEVPKRYIYPKLAILLRTNSDFCPIALLNVQGKLFFSLVSKRLETHVINNNNFINNTIQKGCMEKIPACWEHLSMVWRALKEARAQKSNLAIIWLGIAKLMGSLPTNWLFLLYIDMVSLLSGWDSLKHITKGFSINHVFNQQLVLVIDINGEFLLAALFL